MHRRRFLVLAGTAATAGCTAGTTPTDDESTDVATPTPESTPTTTPATTDASPDREAPPSTDRPEGTPTRGEELLERGRTHLLAAIQAFVGAADVDEPTIVDVTAATDGFSRFDVSEENQSARRRLTEAKKLTSPENTRRADELLAVAAFVDRLGFAQLHLVNAHDEVNRAERSLFTESYDSIPDDVDELARQRDAAAEYAEEIRTSFDESTVAPIEAISGAEFTAKVTQIDRELAAFGSIATHLAGVGAAMREFEEQVRHYTARRYDDATFSASDFADVGTGLGAVDPPVSLEADLVELTCVFDALAEGTRLMRDATFARQNGNGDDARASEADAEAAYGSCERLVEDVRPVADLVASIPQ